MRLSLVRFQSELRTQRVSKIFITLQRDTTQQERYGVKALGEWLAKEHDLDVEFYWYPDNPV